MPKVKTCGDSRLGCHRFLRQIASLLLIVAPLAHAHDFWLATSEWHAEPGTTIIITANVGDDSFPISQYATAADRVDSLRILGPVNHDISALYYTPGKSLATKLALPSTPGTYVVSMTIKPRLLSMKAKAFTKYLQDEGLDQIVEERRRLNETSQASREFYSRQAKLLINTKAGVNVQVTQPVGLEAELVPSSDFTQALPGEDIAVRFIYKGKPVADAQITLTHVATGPIKSRRTQVRTDKDGNARFKLPRRGPYLLTAVHMVRTLGDDKKTVEWRSYWCSLSFDRELIVDADAPRTK